MLGLRGVWNTLFVIVVVATCANDARSQVDAWTRLPDAPFQYGFSAGGGLATDGRYIYAADFSGDGDSDFIDVNRNLVDESTERLDQLGIPNGSVRIARFDPLTSHWDSMPPINPAGVPGDAFSAGDFGNPLFVSGGSLYYFQFRGGPVRRALYSYDLSSGVSGAWQTLFDVGAPTQLPDGNASIRGMDVGGEPVIICHFGGGGYILNRVSQLRTTPVVDALTPNWPFEGRHFPRNGSFEYDQQHDRIYHLSGNQLIGWRHNDADYPAQTFLNSVPDGSHPISLYQALIESTDDSLGWDAGSENPSRGTSLWGNSLTIVNDATYLGRGPSGEDTGREVLYLVRGESSADAWPFNEGRGLINNANIARYFPGTGRFQNLPDAPFQIGKGSCAVYLNGRLYVSQGDSLTLPDDPGTTGPLPGEGIRAPGRGFAAFQIKPQFVPFQPNHRLVFDGVGQESDILEFDENWSLVRSFKASLPAGGRLEGPGWLRWGEDGHLYSYGRLYLPQTGWRIGVQEWGGDGSLLSFRPLDPDTTVTGFDVGAEGEVYTIHIGDAVNRLRQWSPDLSTYATFEVTVPGCPGDEELIRVGSKLYIATNHCIAVFDIPTLRQDGVLHTQHDNNRLTASSRGALCVNRQWYSPPFSDAAFVEMYRADGERIGSAVMPQFGWQTTCMGYDDAEHCFVGSTFDENGSQRARIVEFGADNRVVRVDAPPAIRGTPVQLTVVPDPAAYRGPDLAIMSASSAGFAVAGDSVPVVWQVRNNGRSDTAPNRIDALYLSLDQVLGPDDLLVATQPTAGNPLRPLYFQTGALAVAIPSGLTPGPYHLLVVVDLLGENTDPTPDDRVHDAGVLNVVAASAGQTTISPSQDGEVQSTPDGLRVSGVKGQWWPLVGHITSPPIEYQRVTEFDLSTFHGIQFARARLRLYIGGESGHDRVSLECVAYSGNGVVDVSDFDVVGTSAGLFAWEAPFLGANSLPIARFIDLDVTSALSKRTSDFLGVALRLEGLPPTFGSNLFNVATPYYNIGVAAIENGDYGGLLRPQLFLEPVASSPDLTVQSVAAPSQGVEGASIEVDWVVANIGTAAAIGPWVDRVLLSLDDTPSSDDQVLVEVPRTDPLLPDDRYTQHGQAPLPAGAIGSRHILVVTDALNQVVETNHEDNNFRVAPNSIIITPPPRPDLVVDTLTTPDVATFGSPITVSWSVQNDGDASAPGPWTDRVYLSSDAMLSGDDTPVSPPLQRPGAASPLNPTAIYSQSIGVTLPINYTSGSFFILLKTDSDGVVAESSESNNVGVRPIALTATPGPDLHITSVTAPSGGVFGQSITTSWSGVNQGNTPAVGVWGDRAYLSRDTIISSAEMIVCWRLFLHPRPPSTRHSRIPRAALLRSPSTELRRPVRTTS
ncbi:MAG: hypothetical protein H7210_03095 [Pyrinomonadaceae bacterium]|nr:hypothetical protein [Phycisphaerales bacterium]